VTTTSSLHGFPPRFQLRQHTVRHRPRLLLPFTNIIITMADDTSSDVSFMSDHDADVYPELRSQKPPVYQQPGHPQGFKRLTMGGRVEFEEAFPGALEIVSSLNPDFYSIPYGVSSRRAQPYKRLD